MGTEISSYLVSLDSGYLQVAEGVKAQNELDKDAFISLLITQMQYQDPLDPVDNSEMLAQLAQFTALEQMMNVAQASQKQLATSMLGQYVEYLYTDDTTGTSSYLIGKVDYVRVSGDTPLLGIGSTEIALSDIYQVYEQSNISASTTAFELIGQTVQGTISEKNALGEIETVVIEGEVIGVEMKDGTPYLVIGTDSNRVSINFEDVQNIVEKPSITGRTVTATYIDEEGSMQTIQGIAEYIRITASDTLVYVQGDEAGQFVEFDNVSLVA